MSYLVSDQLFSHRVAPYENLEHQRFRCEGNEFKEETKLTIFIIAMLGSFLHFLNIEITN